MKKIALLVTLTLITFSSMAQFGDDEKNKYILGTFTVGYMIEYGRDKHDNPKTHVSVGLWADQGAILFGLDKRVQYEKDSAVSAPVLPYFTFMGKLRVFDCVDICPGFGVNSQYSDLYLRLYYTYKDAVSVGAQIGNGWSASIIFHF